MYTGQKKKLSAPTGPEFPQNDKNATWRWQWAHLVICTCYVHYFIHEPILDHVDGSNCMVLFLYCCLVPFLPMRGSSVAMIWIGIEWTLFVHSLSTWVYFLRYELLSSLIFCPVKNFITDRWTDRQKAMYSGICYHVWTRRPSISGNGQQAHLPSHSLSESSGRGEFKAQFLSHFFRADFVHFTQVYSNVPKLHPCQKWEKNTKDNSKNAVHPWPPNWW